MAHKGRILLISLDKLSFFDEMYEPLLSKLKEKATVDVVEEPKPAISTIKAGSRSISAILLTDPALTHPKYAKVWYVVLDYIRGGGVAICMGHFPSFAKPLSLGPFFQMAGLGWKSGAYTRSSFRKNEDGIDITLAATLPSAINIKALFVAYLKDTEAWYRDTEEHQAPIAMAEVGSGRLGYVGDVNAEEESNAVILSMCDLGIARTAAFTQALADEEDNDEDGNQDIDYDANGKAICFYHKLRVCPICCFDFTFDESDEDYESYEDDEDNEGGILPTGYAYDVLNGKGLFPSPRTTPVNFPPNLRLETNFFLPGASPFAPVTSECGKCELTWLSCPRSPGVGHPYHNESASAGIPHYPTRSLIVQVDGSCPGNGSSSSGVAASIGVYFASGSKYNISALVSREQRASNQKAELESALSALGRVRTKVIPDRRREFVHHKGNKSEALVPKDELRLSEMGFVDFRVIIQTDSSYLVECFTKHKSSWTRNPRGEWVNKRGNVIKNGPLFDAIEDEIQLLGSFGVGVAWYHVERKLNSAADKLARQAFGSS